MRKQFVFLAHGMGRHPTDEWAKPWTEVIYENLRQYAPYTDLSNEELAKDHLELIPLNYDEVFEKSFRVQQT